MAKVATNFDVPHQMILTGIAGLAYWHFHYKIEQASAGSFRVDIFIIQL
jgi:hypothetical protein